MIFWCHIWNTVLHLIPIFCLISIRKYEALYGDFFVPLIFLLISFAFFPASEERQLQLSFSYLMILHSVRFFQFVMSCWGLNFC